MSNIPRFSECISINCTQCQTTITDDCVHSECSQCANSKYKQCTATQCVVSLDCYLTQCVLSQCQDCVTPDCGCSCHNSDGDG